VAGPLGAPPGVGGERVSNGGEAGLQAPPWDWSGYDEDAWCDALEDLGRWADWLQQSYRWVELRACWPAHEGLRCELDAFRWWWEELHLHRPLNDTAIPSAESLVRWHSSLRAAAAAWREKYLNCTHTGLDVDGKKRPLEDLGRQRRDYGAEAWTGHQVTGR